MTKSTTRTSIICLWVWMIPCVFFLAGSTHHSSPLTGVAAWSSDNSMSTSSIRRRPGTFSRPQQQQQQQHAPTTTTTTTALFTLNDSGEQNTRRNFLLQSSSLLLSVPSAVLLSPAVAAATDQDNASATNTTPTPAKSSSPVYQRQNVNSKISYSISVPSTFQETQKPVKTHLDEINFVSDDVKGYQFGITVDPVRINSLKEFGTPEEVAARVVTAEVNRDGVFEVTLLEDPYEVDGQGAYLLQYLSVGKRGNKHVLNKIFIQNNQLFVLTAQVKQDDYAVHAEELKQIVDSFRV